MSTVKYIIVNLSILFLAFTFFSSCGEGNEITNPGEDDGAQITHFSLPEANIDGTIEESITKIGINKQGKDLSNQIPEISFSDGASISPDPSQPQDFNDVVEYTVTAQDGSVQKYLVVDISKIENFEIHKGINVASWLHSPKYDSPEGKVAFFTEHDVELLSELGFDHIRLLISEEELWGPDGSKIRTYGFDLLHDAIEWCTKHNIRVMVDLHSIRNSDPLFTDPNEDDEFVKLWEDLSDELSKYHNSLVAYELLNEVEVEDAEDWNRASAKAIDAIRSKEPDRTIILGPAITTKNFVKKNFEALTLPSNHNILFTFHYYRPYLFTAYGFPATTGGRQDIPIQYPGQLVPDEWISELPENRQSAGQTYFDKNVLAKGIFEKGINTAERLDVPVFIGEFGVLNTISEPHKSNWFSDVVELCDENNIPYTVFDYKGKGFAMVSEEYEILYPNVLNALTGE